MNILMLNPPFPMPISRATRGPAVGRSGSLYYPYWLAYATGVLEDAGHEVRLVDAIARKHSLQEVLRIANELEPELIVIDVTAPSMMVDLQTAAVIKEATGGFVVAVGPHPTVAYDLVFEKGEAIDAIARGEFDYTLRDVASRLENGEDMEGVAGLSYRDNGSIVHNIDRPFIEDLDALPFVSRVYKKHLRIEDYFYSANRHPEVTLISGRGCAHHCIWCLYPQTMTGHRFRTRSPENFVEELAYVKREFPQVKEIFIEDDTFTMIKPRAHKICELIRRRKLKICWACNVRADVDLDTLRAMKAAGCRMILSGFESGNQAVLDAMKKKLKIKRAQQFAQDARKAGLVLHACFTAGGPAETRETLNQTLEYAMEVNPTTAQFCPLMVYPGTEAYEWANSNGYLATTDFSEWITSDGTHNSQVSTPELSAAQLTAFCNYARRKFYLRPRYLLKTACWASVRPLEWRRMARATQNLYGFLSRYGKEVPV